MVRIINIDTKTRTIRVSNADGDIKTWRTTESGTHFPIREGESTKEALDKFVEKKSGLGEKKVDSGKPEDSEKAKHALQEVIRNVMYRDEAKGYGYSGPEPEIISDSDDEKLLMSVYLDGRDTKEKIDEVKKQLSRFWGLEATTEKGQGDQKNYVFFELYKHKAEEKPAKPSKKNDPNEFIKKAAEQDRKYEEAKEKLPKEVGQKADQEIHDLNKKYGAIVDSMPQGKEKTDKIHEWVEKYHAIQDKVIQQTAKKESGSDAGLDRELARGGLSDDEISILRNRLQDYYDISDQTLLSAIKSGEYSVKEIYKRLRNYDDDFADHLVDLEDGTVPESKQQFVWSEKEKQQPKKDDGEELEPWEKEKREKKEPTRAGDIVKIKYSDGSFGVGKVNCFTTHDNEIGCEVEDDQGRLRFYPKKQLEALKYVPKSEITDGWTNDSYYNGIKGEHMRAELYKDPAVKEAARKRVERSQSVEAETGVSPEDWEAYESVRQSGASNMYDYAYINATTGLPRETIRKIQENYEKLQEAYGQD